MITLELMIGLQEQVSELKETIVEQAAEIAELKKRIIAIEREHEQEADQAMGDDL